jgi:hypothetical protein
VRLTQTPCLRLVMRRSAVGDDRRLRTKVSNTASADACTQMDSPGRSYRAFASDPAAGHP